jgi:GGDEF domain-containing protein
MYEDKWHFYADNPEGHPAEQYGLRDIKRMVSGKTEITEVADTDRDYLTGLLNRNAFMRFADRYQKVMHQRDTEIAIVYFNLSGMKNFNKKYGFSEGDILIKTMAKIIEQEFGSDQSGRFGQDHFAVFTERKGLEKKLKEDFESLGLPTECPYPLENLEAAMALDKKAAGGCVKWILLEAPGRVVIKEMSVKEVMDDLR